MPTTTIQLPVEFNHRPERSTENPSGPTAEVPIIRSGSVIAGTVVNRACERLAVVDISLQAVLDELRVNAGALAAARVHVALLVGDLHKALSMVRTTHGSLEYHLNKPLDVPNTK